MVDLMSTLYTKNSCVTRHYPCINVNGHTGVSSVNGKIIGGSYGVSAASTVTPMSVNLSNPSLFPIAGTTTYAVNVSGQASNPVYSVITGNTVGCPCVGSPCAPHRQFRHRRSVSGRQQDYRQRRPVCANGITDSGTGNVICANVQLVAARNKAGAASPENLHILLRQHEKDPYQGPMSTPARISQAL
jgi:hypothetical protein